MLTITIGESDHWDKEKEEFVRLGGTKVTLEHSLVALSKWESIHEKPYLTETPKTTEEVFDYIRCMVVGDEIPPEVFDNLSQENMSDISDYINAKRSATWFNDQPGAPRSRETLTSELIYYWMFAAGVSIECETWHLNRLFTLLKVFTVKNAKPKKMNRQEMAARNRELNAQRKAELGTKG